MVRLLATSTVLLTLTSAASPLGGPIGAIMGRVEIRQQLEPIERRPNISDLGMPTARDYPDRRRSVVYLETAPQGAFEEGQPRRLAMDQRNETFVPHVLAVHTGTVVDFPNNDRTYHNVFSLSPVRPFDLGRYAAGSSKSVRFDRPGIVRVFCDIHSHMSAYILVFAHRYFSVTDEAGRYRIQDVPPGSYTVTAWNELLAPVSKPVTIPQSGGDVELHFLLGDRP